MEVECVAAKCKRSVCLFLLFVGLKPCIIPQETSAKQIRAPIVGLMARRSLMAGPWDNISLGFKGTRRSSEKSFVPLTALRVKEECEMQSSADVTDAAAGLFFLP